MAGRYALLRAIPTVMEIPEEGTLSRVLHKDDRLRVVGFAFDEGQELTEHTSAMAAVVQVLTGSFSVGVDGDVFDLGPADWLVMEPGAPHSVKALEPGVMLLTLVRD